MIWIFDDQDRLITIATNENPDALPVLSATFNEVLNGDYLLDFEVPLDHKNAEFIQEGNSCAIQREDGNFELFIINEIQEIKGNEATLAVSCSHAVQELADDIIIGLFGRSRQRGHCAACHSSWDALGSWHDPEYRSARLYFTNIACWKH